MSRRRHAMVKHRTPNTEPNSKQQTPDIEHQRNPKSQTPKQDKQAQDGFRKHREQGREKHAHKGARAPLLIGPEVEPGIEVWCLEVLWCLVFGVWCLVFFIAPTPPPNTF